MTTRRPVELALVCVLGSLAFLPVRSAQAYTLKETEAGAPVRWNEGAVRLWIAPSGCGPDADALRAAVVAAAGTWSGVGDAPRVVIGVGHPPARIGYDPRETEGNGVYVLCDDWPYDEHLAVTASTFDEHSGALYDTDIVIDGRAPLSAASETPQDAYDLTSLLTHEMGHVLGLDESDDRGATMSTRAVLGDARRRSLEADDEAAIDALYGKPFSTASCSAAHGPAPEGTTLAFFAVVLVALRRRFRNAR